eukprot:6205537-Pleurochrysis_carterae.AAC.3
MGWGAGVAGAGGVWRRRRGSSNTRCSRSSLRRVTMKSLAVNDCVLRDKTRALLLLAESERARLSLPLISRQLASPSVAGDQQDRGVWFLISTCIYNRIACHRTIDAWGRIVKEQGGDICMKQASCESQQPLHAHCTFALCTSRCRVPGHSAAETSHTSTNATQLPLVVSSAILPLNACAR